MSIHSHHYASVTLPDHCYDTPPCGHRPSSSAACSATPVSEWLRHQPAPSAKHRPKATTRSDK
eukprot:10510571-Alexandrium_andersonii.AAC.1